MEKIRKFSYYFLINDIILSKNIKTATFNLYCKLTNENLFLMIII